MTTTITQRTSRFWLQKLQEQIATIRKKDQNEPLERAFALDIALAYLFLYLFVEATIDQIVLNILNQTVGLKSHRRYRKRSRYLRGKLEFILTEFCSQLPFKEFATLWQRIWPLVAIRNRIVHLEELSWSVSWEESQKPKEKPTTSTKYLTVRGLRSHYCEVRDFLASLAITLNRGFEDAKIDIEHREGDQSETKAHNLIEFVYQISLPVLKDFEEIV